jgi:translation initiation factor IF-2
MLNGVEIESAKIDTLARWLIQAEKINLKTREKADDKMIAEIQKKIEEVVKCY